jgi:hypothetical protein
VYSQRYDSSVCCCPSNAVKIQKPSCLSSSLGW